MPTAITMRGLLEPIVINENFLETTTALNMAAAKGSEFVICNAPDGEPVAFATHNILTVKEIEGDF